MPRTTCCNTSIGSAPSSRADGTRVPESRSTSWTSTPIEPAAERVARAAGQRVHDAILDMARRLLSSGTLPTTGGTPATVLLTMTLEQLESRTGLVTTGHGGQLTVNQALRLAGEADVIPVVIDTDGILGYGRTRRTASAMQRRALAARDGGCVMAGCDYTAMSACAKSRSPARDEGALAAERREGFGSEWAPTRSEGSARNRRSDQKIGLIRNANRSATACTTDCPLLDAASTRPGAARNGTSFPTRVQPSPVDSAGAACASGWLQAPRHSGGCGVHQRSLARRRAIDGRGHGGSPVDDHRRPHSDAGGTRTLCTS
ncbi:MAG: DUF222 domain-containing protein [Jatrophihabitans sp.]